MHPTKSIPEPWLSFLRELDSAVHEEVRLDCMGGFLVTMVYGFSRPTGDLDVLEIAPMDAGRSVLELGMQGGTLHKKYKIYLDHVGVARVPENYEERLTEIFPRAFKHLRLLALDPYDLTLLKLERNIQRDRDDVMHLAKTSRSIWKCSKSDIRRSCAGSWVILSAKTSPCVCGLRPLKKREPSN